MEDVEFDAGDAPRNSHGTKAETGEVMLSRRDADDTSSPEVSSSKTGKRRRSTTPQSLDDIQNNEGIQNDGKTNIVNRTKARPGRTRRAPDNVADSIPIPRTVASFSEADKAMWDMRKAGKGWEEIRLEWERITGQKVAGTTLPNRYVRIKENIGDFNDDDDQLLLRCKQELEKTFSDELWSMVSEAMTSKGGNKFSAAAIQKRFKQLCEDVAVGP